MATNSDKKLTRYTSAVTVVTSEVMNSLFGGEYGSNTSLDAFHPLVGGHVHDGEHADGHASKVLLSNGSHVRGYLSHSNLGGTDGTTPAVQAKNIQCYSENVYGPNGGGLSIPEYTTDPDTGERCYYLDLSMTIGGPDKSIQFNQNGEFSGSNDFVYDYVTGNVGIGIDTPSNKLEVFGDGKFNGDLEVDGKLTVTGLIDPTGLILSEEYASNVPTGEGFGAIFVSKDDGSLVQNKLYYKDAYGGVSELGGVSSLTELSDVDIDQQRLGSSNSEGGEFLKYNSQTGKWFAAEDSGRLVEANLLQWPADGGDIVLGESANGRLNIILGEWNGSGKVVIPEFQDSVSKQWLNGDNFWIKNLTTYTIEAVDYGYATLTVGYNQVGQSYSGPIPIQIVSDNSRDTLDNEIFPSPYYLLHKSAIRLSCIKDTESINKWILISHYHEVNNVPDNPPVSVIEGSDEYGGSAVEKGDLVSYGTRVALSGVNSYDPNGDAITSYTWTLNSSISSTSETFTGESLSIDTYQYSDADISVTLIVSANGLQSTPEEFNFSVERSNSAPVVSIDAPDKVGENYSVTLLAIASDSDGDALSYSWSLGSKPSSSIASIDGVNTADRITLNLDIPGDYEFAVTVSDGRATSFDTHIVTVDAKPEITLLGSANIEVLEGSTYIDSGATASDPEDGDITSNIITSNPVDTALPGLYYIRYNVFDSIGQPANEKMRSVRVVANNAPTITLLGDASVVVDEGTTYTDAGATASDSEEGDITSSIRVSGSVNTSVPGNYTITYDVTDSLGKDASSVFRSVRVNAKPTITMAGQAVMSITEGTTYVEPGVTASDPEDGDLTSLIITQGSVNTAIVGYSTLTYQVSDSDGATAYAVRSVQVVANNAPVITLLGQPSITIDEGVTYTDAGATASDPEDGNITSSIIVSNSVDTSVPGTYSVTYNVTDSLGLAAAQVSRTVIVEAVNTAPGITVSPTSVTINEGDTYGDSEIRSGVIASDNEDDNFGLTQQITYSSNLNTTIAGTYTITYNVTDSGGLSATPVTRTVIVERVNAAPTVTNLSVSNSNGVVAIDQPNDLSGDIADSDGSLVSYEWAVVSSPSGSNWTLNPFSEVSGSFGSSRTVTATLTTDTEGSYDVVLRATDDDGDIGSGSFSVQIQKNPNTLPGAEVSFAKSSSEPTDIYGLNYGVGYFDDVNVEVLARDTTHIAFNASNSSDAEDGSNLEHQWYVLDAPKDSIINPYLGVLNPSDGSASGVIYGTNSFGERAYMAMKLDIIGDYEVVFRLKDSVGMYSNVVRFLIKVA